MSNETVLLGVLVMLVGVALILLGLWGKGRLRVGGFLGPIPFGFATDKHLFYLVVAVTAAVVVLSLISALMRG